MAEAISDEIASSLPAKADLDRAIEKVKSELLQAIHVTEQRLSEQLSGCVKWFFGILFVQPGILASLTGWFLG
jgi:hypothetical protein